MKPTPVQTSVTAPGRLRLRIDWWPVESNQAARYARVPGEVRDGETSTFALRAEAGDGKTRLFEEFRAQLCCDLQRVEGRFREPCGALRGGCRRSGVGHTDHSARTASGVGFVLRARIRLA